jgi:RNA polymerase sigma-32 factor
VSGDPRKDTAAESIEGTESIESIASAESTDLDEVAAPTEAVLLDDADDADSRLPVLIDPQAAPVPRPDSRDAGSADTLTRYMSELRHHAPITREEEQRLARRWVETGDVEAARLLVVSNLRLVVKIAMEYRRAWTNTLDLIQEGNVGLLEAVQRFDPYKGVKLSTYAVYWIRAYILKHILDNMRSVRIGTTRAQRKLFYRLNKEKRELESQGYDVSPKLIAERLDVTEQDVIEMEVRLSRPDISVDAKVGDDEGSATYGDFMRAGGESAEHQVGEGELASLFRTHVEAFRKELSERDLQILNERMLAEEPRTLADMGEEFGITRERVRQLEARLVKRLRDYMKDKLVDFDYYAPDLVE